MTRARADIAAAALPAVAWAITTVTAMANTIFAVHLCQHIGRTVAHCSCAPGSGGHFVSGTLLSYTFTHDLYATASSNDGTLRDVRRGTAHIMWW